jgi:hypothetical protein
MFQAFTFIRLLVLGLRQKGRIMFAWRKVRKYLRCDHTFFLQMVPLLNAHRAISTEPSYCHNNLLDIHHSVVLTTCLAAAKHVQTDWHIKKWLNKCHWWRTMRTPVPSTFKILSECSAESLRLMSAVLHLQPTEVKSCASCSSLVHIISRVVMLMPIAVKGNWMLK